MTRKFLNISLIIITILLLYTCGGRRGVVDDVATYIIAVDFSFFNYFYATPTYDSGLMPIRISVKNDSLFVQYVSNGKLIDKGLLVYSHSEFYLPASKWSRTTHVFYKMLDGEKVNRFLFENTHRHYFANGGFPGMYALIGFNNPTVIISERCGTWFDIHLQNTCLSTADIEKSIFNTGSFRFLYATHYADEHLPIKISAKNGALFVQRIQNGRLLHKFPLLYHHTTHGYDPTHSFDKIVDGKVAGRFIIQGKAFDCFTPISISYLSHDEYTWFDMRFSFSERSVCEEYEWEEYEWEGKCWYYCEEYGNCHTCMPCVRIYYARFQELVYSIFLSDTIASTASYDDRYNSAVSSDGNLKIYNIIYRTGMRGLWSTVRKEIVQFRYGDTVSPFGRIALDYKQHSLWNPWTEQIKIHTVTLGGRTFYLIDRAVRCSRTFRGNGNVLHVYAIENGELVQQRLFRHRNGTEAVAYILVGFYCEYYSHREYGRWNVFRVDERFGSIFVPQIRNGVLISRYAEYLWDGWYWIEMPFNPFHQQLADAHEQWEREMLKKEKYDTY